MVTAQSACIAPREIRIPAVTKAVKIAMVCPQGTLVYDTNAKKLSVKTEDATAVASWENVTSVDDA